LLCLYSTPFSTHRFIEHIFIFYDDFTLDDVALTLGDDMNAGVSNEIHVTDGKPLILTVK